MWKSNAGNIVLKIMIILFVSMEIDPYSSCLLVEDGRYHTARCEKPCMLPVPDSHPQVTEQPLPAVRPLGLPGALVSPKLLQLTQTVRLQQVGQLFFYLRRFCCHLSQRLRTSPALCHSGTFHLWPVPGTPRGRRDGEVKWLTVAGQYRHGNSVTPSFKSQLFIKFMIQMQLSALTIKPY